MKHTNSPSRIVQKWILFSLLAFLFHAVSFGQSTLVLQPNAAAGEDQLIGSYYPNTSSGNGSAPELNAMAWTQNGGILNERAMLRFNLSSIPAGSLVISAKLTLYFNPTSANLAQHSQMGGSNAAGLYQITSPWTENTVTWNTQPTYSTSNYALLPADTNPSQNYIIDVTSMVQSMVNSPATNYGFLLKLLTEQYYRGLTFASSDHPDSTLHPKLEITYGIVTPPSGIATADGPTTFCSGDYVYLSATYNIGATYQWKKNNVAVVNGNTRTYKATSSGTYKCQITNSLGSTTTNSIVVATQANAASTVTAAGPSGFCAGDSVVLNATNPGANYSIQWYRTNISINGANAYSLTVKQPGTYKVVTKNNTTGCSRISSTSITTTVNCRITNPTLVAVSDENRADRIQSESETKKPLVYPNPNTGVFTIEYFSDGYEGSATIVVLNTMGQKIYQTETEVSGGLLHEEMNLGDQLQKGIYIVRINLNGEVHDSRVMLQ